MKKKIRELTDRKRGISNAVREKNYQDYVRGWVNYFRLADMLDEFALQKTMYELNEKIKLILNLMNQPQKNKSQKTMSFDEYMKEAKAINNIFIINVSISIKLYRNPYTF